ncbi:hypothetical protein [Yoonia maritima]|uniref:hypothetical protein n=1 Tax=Yoonia maritima TaxID=1435347 RepID=UPI000D0EBE67|nr:hypothetical protein [Yoonia maritima]
MTKKIAASNAGLDQHTKRFVIYVTVIVTSIIALAVILVVALLPIFWPTKELPQTLTNWGGLIIGFYFGSFVTLLKDWSRESVEIVEATSKSGTE